MNTTGSVNCVLLTGATGFLGAQIARQLLAVPNLVLIPLVRATDPAEARRRLARAWWDWTELHEALSTDSRVEVLAGDVTLPCLGLDESCYSSLAGRLTHIIHTAADLRLTAPLADLRRTNVQGTANILQLARRAPNLQRFGHVSTAYVAGLRTGAILEDSLPAPRGFSNPYEQSKFEGEQLVQAARQSLPVSVFRPGMITGAAGDGEIRTFNTIYYPLRLLLTGKLPILPASPAQLVNIVPVDYVASSIVRLTFTPEAQGLTFHLTLPADSLPRAGELVDFTRAWARKQLGLRLRRPIFIPPPFLLPTHRPGLTSGALTSLLPYFNDRRQFQRNNLDRLLGPCQLDWHDFLPRILAYATRQGFMHRTGRTVHEQLLTRLDGKTYPVRYFDVLEGQLIEHSAVNIRREIITIASALKALGVQAGDRVALVGLNSARYLALDAAIGLAGAVSVPLYYTSPASDIEHILSASGARMLFVGAQHILARLDEIQADVPVISFCRAPVSIELDHRVLSWETFLAHGESCSSSLPATARLGDLASLRYTSGTTGQPKGVVFQHHHLRWMAETMASLLPWKTRIRPAHYLSCLPMNHVVEGILATYSPYFLPTALNIYFLEDIKAIQAALPRVRPTVFFSVPRIYERIWEKLESNPLGRFYLRTDTGWLKTVLRPLLRRKILRKAGLDRCAQLITGSAPCSMELLQNFHELGIEIHNAYGLSEAPLISMNRYGANHLGTVGEPLPQTDVRIAPDGEILVRGPQVMAGYFHAASDPSPVQPFHDGWLLTGDLGSLTPEGRLVITGRKKELLKTSYGKYIQPARVEALLKQIPGVTEAMLVGEQRPYCTALLWVQAGTLDAAAGQRLDELVRRCNASLSHPEQVKRWAVLPNDLTVESGDLTANLKLKRQVVARRLAGVLENLYDGARVAAPVLHTGAAERG